MDKNEMIVATIKDFRARTRMSMAASAKAIGLKGASSWQRYEKPELLPNDYLPRDVVVKLEKAFSGKGTPPIAKEEVWALAGPEFSNRTRVVSTEPYSTDTVTTSTKPNASFPPRYQKFPGDVAIPVRGHISAGANGRFIMNGQDIAHVFCPPGLEDVEGAYAVIVQGSSGEPRFYNGETAWINPHARVREKDDVIVQVLEDDGEVASYIKRYVSRSNDLLRLYQYNPDEGESHELQFDNKKIFSVHKVVFHALL